MCSIIFLEKITRLEWGVGSGEWGVGGGGGGWFAVR